jgi:hypothetical protein
MKQALIWVALGWATFGLLYADQVIRDCHTIESLISKPNCPQWVETTGLFK